jgi:DNA-3-methyladenine glycosylase II
VINVLDPHQQAAARFTRQFFVHQCRIGMAQMQVPIGTWRKSENGLHFAGLVTHIAEMQCYTSVSDLENAITHLVQVEPRFKVPHARHGTPSLRAGTAGLEGLLMIVTEQFLSLQAAAAIWQRLVAAITPFTADELLKTSADHLRSLGLSQAKIRSFHGIARACAEGQLNLDVVATLDDDSVRQTLLALPGVGPWTIDIYLLSALARADAWPCGDLALQKAAGNLFGLADTPSAKAMVELALPWRPHRAAAARLLWAHYRGLKGLTQA